MSLWYLLQGAQQDGLYPGPTIWCYAPAHISRFSKSIWIHHFKTITKTNSDSNSDFF